MGKKVGKMIGNMLDGAQQALKGVGQIVGGIFTFDGDMIGKGLGNVFNGALNVITFGLWGGLVDWVSAASKPNTPEQSYTGRKVMSRGSDTPRAVLYGRCRVGGQLVYMESTGADSQQMHMIVVVAPHRVHDIREIYFNNELAFDDNGQPAPAFQGKAELIKVLGEQTGANTTITSRLTEWTSDHKLLGCAYIYVRLFYDKELYSRAMPEIQVVVDGKLIYDPGPDTVGFSTNHALICLDYLRSDFGFRATDEEIDIQSFLVGAGICAQQVTAGPSITEPRYTVNGTVLLSANPIDNLNSLARAGAANINYEQGVFSYVPGVYVAPATGADFNEDDLVGGIEIISGMGKAELTNTAKGTYIDPRLDFEPTPFPTISPSDYVARDGEELVSDLPMPFANTPTLARRLAKIAIEQSRFGVRVQASFKWRAMSLVPGDRIRLSIARLGWVNKVFRVLPGGFDVSMGRAITLSLAEDAPSVWGWVEGEAIDVTPPPALRLPTTTPIPAPTNLTIVERINTPNTAAANRVTVFLSVTPPVDQRYATSEFSYRLAGTNDVWSVIGYERLGASKVLPASGDTYEFRARPVSTVGRVWDTEIVESYTVFDVMTEGAKDALELRLPDIYGLRILNTVPGTLNEFKSGNAEFAWQPQSSTIFTEFSDDRIGVDAGQLDPFFDDYRLRFYSSGVLRFEDYARQPRYTLSLEDNRRYNIGRAFRCEVTARGANGQVGRPESIDVVNPASGIVTGITSEQVEDGVFLTYTPPDDIDFVGVRIRNKLYTGSSITIDPLTARSETITITSVDQFGDGDSTTFELTNPAPAAPSGIQTAVGIGSFTVRFVPDSSDFDFVGTKFEWRPVGGSYTAPVVLRGNEATQNGLDQDTEYEIRLTSVDKLGDGGSTTVIVTTASLDASEVNGLGAWATRLTPADLAFIAENVANDAVESEKIAFLIASKIAAGAIAVQVDVGEDSNRVLLDGETGVVQTVNSGFTVTMGAHVVDGVTYVLSGNDGLIPTFGFLPNGGVDIGYGGVVYDPSTDTTTFSGALAAGSGFFGSLAGQYVSFDGTNLEIETPQLKISGGNATFSGTLAADIITANQIVAGSTRYVDTITTTLNGSDIENGKNINIDTGLPLNRFESVLVDITITQKSGRIFAPNNSNTKRFTTVIRYGTSNQPSSTANSGPFILNREITYPSNQEVDIYIPNDVVWSGSFKKTLAINNQRSFVIFVRGERFNTTVEAGAEWQVDIAIEVSYI
jgi:hypothetical protein